MHLILFLFRVVVMLWAISAWGHHNVIGVYDDRILVAVDPSRHTRYRENTLYLRAAEHRREGFIYLHNVRQLFPADPAGDSLSRHMHRIN